MPTLSHTRGLPLSALQDGAGWSFTGPDGLDTQQIWRYSAATGAWTLIYSYKYNYNLVHLLSTYIRSLAAAGSNMLLAVWDGKAPDWCEMVGPTGLARLA